MNLDAGVGVLYDGTLFIKESHFYIKGSKIEKIGEDSYHVADGHVTSCDGDSPVWEFTGKDLRVTIEGYGTVKHAAFWAKSVPLLYTPFLVFPAKTKRQTGLLVPLVYRSSMDGYQYNQPFFWAISESSDATVYEHYMERRGLKHGLEYRYVLAPETKGTAMYDYLYDRQIDDSTPIPEADRDGGYHYEGFRGDDEDRLNKKRWWFRMKHDQNLPAGFKAKLDLDLVSDQDYLREFETGYSGYEYADRYFLEEFGRELDDQTDTVRTNQLNLNRGWDKYSLNVDFRWYDDVIIRKNNQPDGTQQNLPSVNFTGSKQALFDTPFYFDLQSSYDHFWSRQGTRGYRADLYPRVYYPTTIFQYFDFEPSVGGRETLWQVEQYEPESPKEEDKLQSREIYDFKADLSTEISRVFNLEGTRVDKINHAIKPQVVYEYVPKLEQEDVPGFVGTIAPKRLVTYSITNNFTARTSQLPSPDPETGLAGEQEQATRPPKYSYHDFCRIRLSQDYDIIEARREKNGKERRPFSDIKGELEFRPYHCLDLDADGTWSPYDDEFTSYNAIVTLCDGRGDYGSVDYRYTRENGTEEPGTESIVTKIFLKLSHPVSVYWEHERNLREKQDIKSVIQFRYQFQCWSIGYTYTHDRAMNEREHLFVIGLYGLGEFELGSYKTKKAE